MRIPYNVITSILLCLIFTSMIAEAQEFSDAERARNDIYKENKRSLVLIENISRGRQGSGLIYDSNGRILTNYHVIHDGKDLEIWVKGRDKTFTDVYILGVDIDKDLAILKINAKDLKPVQLEELKKHNREYENVMVGMDVLAFGNPLLSVHSLTKGIISSIRRSEEVPNVKFHKGYEVFQTDAPTEHGSSGGALLNMQGKVIGVTVIGIAPGFNFAIPVNYAQELISKLPNGSRGTRSQEYEFPDIRFNDYYFQAFDTRQRREIIEYVTVPGNVFDAETRKPVDFADVFPIGKAVFDTTDENGLFELDIAKTEGLSSITLNVSASDYKPLQRKIDIRRVPEPLLLFIYRCKWYERVYGTIRPVCDWGIPTVTVTSLASWIILHLELERAKEEWPDVSDPERHREKVNSLETWQLRSKTSAIIGVVSCAVWFALSRPVLGRTLCAERQITPNVSFAMNASSRAVTLQLCYHRY
jgi:hypothetical protein